MKVESLPIAKLVLDPSNARKHSPKNLEAIKGSLAKFGQQKPIVVGKGNVVIAGNGTLEAARSLGWDAIDVVRTTLEGPDATAFAIADNRTGELAEWDAGVLGETLKALQGIDFDLGAIGFDADDLAAMTATPAPKGLTDPDAMPEDVETRCKPGDLWILGDHRLLCGDSTNVQHVERLMGGEKADMCFTSPPYADMRDYGGNDLDPKLLASFLTFDNADVYVVNLGLKRKDHEIIPYWDTYVTAAKDAGLKLLAWSVWDKGEAGSFSNQQAMFPLQHEWLFVFGKERREVKKTEKTKHAGSYSAATVREKSGETTRRKKGIVEEFKRHGSVFHFTPVKGARDHDHPAPFPVEMPEYFVDAMGARTVYEPFTGSGSTLIACEKTARRCFGMEIDPKYVDVILKRWENFTGKEARLEGNA